MQQINLQRSWYLKELQLLELAIYELATLPYEIKIRIKIAWSDHLWKLTPSSYSDLYLKVQAEDIVNEFHKNISKDKFFYNKHGTTMAKLANKIWKLKADLAIKLKEF